VIENIIRVRPGTTDIAVVIGNSTIEKYWLGQMRAAFQPYANRIAFTFFNNLSFDEMLKRAAALPSTSAIFFYLLSVDAGGHSREETIDVANAPSFNYLDTSFGDGIVGGPLISLSTNDPVRPCNLKLQRRNLTPGLRRPVEPAGRGNPENICSR
jgi:hypothetical protein